MILELMMLLCFGAAWPFAVYKSYKSRSAKGKSIFFLFSIFFGYVFGIFNKLFNHYDWVTYFYLLNAILVAADIALYYRNKILYNNNNH